MAVTPGGTPYVESSDLVANYPAVSLALAEHIDNLPAAVLQVVRATDTTARTTNSTSFVDVTGMSVTITPQKNTSAILILAVFSASINTPINDSFMQMETRITDSSNNPISGAQKAFFLMQALMPSGASLFLTVPHTLIAYATPATTSATTYKLQFRMQAAADTGTLNNADNTGQMYAIEVSA
jgi:hypothetical protein